MAKKDTNTHQRLNEMYVQACGDLLSAYGLKVDIQQIVSDNSDHQRTGYVSILSATGEAIGLFSMLRIDRELVVRTHPLGSDSITTVDLEDWCRELNNQLVGRMKNKVLGFGHVLVMSLPVMLTGTNVSPVLTTNSEVHQYSVKAEDGQVTCTLSTFVNPDTEFQELESPVGGEEVLVEGAIAFF